MNEDDFAGVVDQQVPPFPQFDLVAVGCVQPDRGGGGAEPRTGLLPEGFGLGEAVGVQHAAGRPKWNELGRWRHGLRMVRLGFVPPAMQAPASEEERDDHNEGRNRFDVFHGFFPFFVEDEGPAHPVRMSWPRFLVFLSCAIADVDPPGRRHAPGRP